MSSKISKCGTLDDLVLMFQQKVSDLKCKVDLRGANTFPSTRTHLQQINASVQELMVCLTLLKLDIQARKKSLEKFEVLKGNVSNLHASIKFASTHLPAKLPQKSPPTIEQGLTKQEEPTFKVPAPVGKKNVKSFTNQSKVGGVTKDSKQGQKLGPPSSIQYLTVHEFEHVPKYMKGRIAYEKVNNAIDQLNKAFVAKHKVLTTPRSGQTDFIKKQMTMYKSQENKDTKGVWFITETDIQEHGMRMDSNCRSILTMLRHCGRIREIRGGKLTRFAIKT